ncbi:hypothetical protein BGZ52_007231, partial [Haplosporangium bisporale]
TLIEHIKNYANPSYAINRSLLGNDNFSKTESTQPFYVKSNLPAYEAYRKDTGEVIDLGDLPSKFDDEEDYRDILFSRERDVGLRLAPQDPNNPSDNIEFRFLDDLGLTNADENDSNHAAIIIDKLILIQTFNLIVITESYKNLLTLEQQLDLDYFANIFKGLHSRIMFLHTHVDYTNIHPTNTTHYLNMKLKNTALSKIFRRFDNESPFDKDNFRVYPSLTIDLVSSKRPIINCLIQNTIREILKMATQPAVPFDTSIQNIERIRAIPYPTQFTDDQLKHAKARLQADADKFEEELAEVQVEQDVSVQNSVEEVQAEKPVGEAEKPVKEASSYDFLRALLCIFCFFCRRRARRECEEYELAGGAGGDQSHYAAHHGGLPPLIPIAPIGDLDEVIVEDKDIPVEEVQAERPVKEASSYDFLLDLLCFFRRRREREQEYLLGGGAGGDHSQYETHHGGIPPLVPIAPIGDLDEVVVEDKDIPGAPDNENNFPGGPSGGVVIPGSPIDSNSNNLDGIKEQDAEVAISGLLEVDIEKRYTHETLHEVIGAVIAGNGVKVVDSGSGSGSDSEESSASSSVLVLGKTQAGKSTFIEFVKNYADQQYTIDERLLGTRIKSKTQMPVPFVVKTDLQAYEVIDATGTRIDIGSLGDKYQDPDDYVDALNDRNITLKPVSHNPVSSLPPRHVQITFLDTPGVEDTNGRDAEHA